MWGLSNKGFTCKACGFNCHAKCEMKVAPNCSKVKGQINPQPTMSSVTSNLSLSSSTGNKTRSQRSASHSSIPTSITTATINYDSAPTPISTLSVTPTTTTAGARGGADLRSLYDYQAENDDELSMKEGDLLHIVQPDDGTGWIKAQRGDQIGMIPANYVEFLNNDTRSSIEHLNGEYYDHDAHELDEPNIHTIPTAPPMAHNSQHHYQQTEEEEVGEPTAPEEHEAPALNETVVALYDFEAVNAEELNIRQGDRIVVIKKDDSGWWEGTLNGQTGVFPANYVGPA